MSASATLTRLAAMDRRELAFRMACEARRAAGRVRYAVAPPRWTRADIVRLLDRGAGPLVARAIDAARRGDYGGAHRALAAHVESRGSRWPLPAARRRSFVEEVLQVFPRAAGDARRHADPLLDGRHDLLGYRGVEVGHPPRWHDDPVNGRRATAGYWSAVPFLDPSVGDHKVIWETNRHQYFCLLGRAYWLTGDRRYREAFVLHIEDWMRANPPLAGINWASMLELAFRTISWAWAAELFGGRADADEQPWLVDLLIGIDRQLAHVAQNLSRYFSPNTHLTGEALALYAVSHAFPELRRSGRRAAQARDVLLREAANQINADGGHAEQSTHYHHYSTSFYLLALMVARAAGDGSARALEEAARRQAVFLRTIADDRGRLPLIGDDDGGQTFRFGPREPSDASATLAVAASLLGDPALAVGSPPEDAFWILGRRPEPPAARPARWPSRVFPDTGYVVSRSSDGGHLVFDAGPHGYLNGGHAHCDALSVVLSAGGNPVLVDPGTATYTMDRELRDRFRSARMHNTVLIGDRDHARPRGPFHWHTRAHARLLAARTGDRLDFAAGTHDAYGSIAARHTRAVVAMHGIGWLIVDRVAADGTVEAAAWWHLHPAWRAVLRDGTASLTHESGARLGLATTAADLHVVGDTRLSAVAPAYGRTEPSTTLRGRHAAPAPFVIGTFIPAAPSLSSPLAIVHARSHATAPGWETHDFGIRAGHVELTVDVAFPTDAVAPPEDWPQPCIDELNVCVE
jgi:hypothetical protein